MQMREKVGKSRNTVFRMICGSGGSKSRLAKAAGAEPAGQMRDEKLHAVVARNTFWSQHVQNTPFSDHFWKLRCRKSARRCGAKRISKSTCTKHTTVRTTFGSWDVEKVHAVVARSTFRSQHVQSTPMSDHFWKLRCRKSAQPFWREAHFQVKMCKTHHVRTTFGRWDVEKVHAVVARSTCRSQHVQNTPMSDHFWKLRCRKSARRFGAKRISKSKCTKHTTFGPLLDVEMSKECTPLWREAHVEVKSAKNWGVRSNFGRSDVVLHGRRKGLRTLSKVSKTWGFCSNFNYNHHYTTLHSNTLHYNYNSAFTTFQYTTLHYTTLHSITLNYTTLHYTTLHYTTLPSTHFTTLHYTTLHNTTTTTTQLHSTTLHYNKLH